MSGIISSLVQSNCLTSIFLLVHATAFYSHQGNSKTIDTGFWVKLGVVVSQMNLLRERGWSRS